MRHEGVSSKRQTCRVHICHCFCMELANVQTLCAFITLLLTIVGTISTFLYMLCVSNANTQKGFQARSHTTLCNEIYEKGFRHEVTLHCVMRYTEKCPTSRRDNSVVRVGEMSGYTTLSNKNPPMPWYLVLLYTISRNVEVTTVGSFHRNHCKQYPVSDPSKCRTYRLI